MTRLLVEGWRGINHSYALANQYQLLELRRMAGIELHHHDLPFFDPAWNRSNNAAGFDEQQRAWLDSIPPLGGAKADVIYRIGFPYRIFRADAERLYVFATSENHRFEPGEFDPGDGDARPHLVTPSRWSRAGLVAAGFDERQVTVVPHGIHPGIYSPLDQAERERCRTGLGINADDILFINVGAMSFNKGIDRLLVAFWSLRQRHRNMYLLLKDQSNLYRITARDMIDDLAKQLPALATADALAATRVLSTNLDLNSLRTLYGSADAYVAPYRAEGFNLPPLEAAACGTPAIFTSGGSTDDYFHPSFALGTDSRKITSDDLGTYLEPDLDHLIANMEQIIERRAAELDPQAGRQWIVENFSWERVTHRLASLLTGAAA